MELSSETSSPTTGRKVALDLTWTFGSRVFSILLGLVGNALSARSLGPVDFGRFGLITAVVMICGTLADAGLTYTAIKFIAQYGGESRGDAGAVARVYFLLRLATGISIGLVGVLMAEPIASIFLTTPGLTPYLQIGFLTLFSLAISSYPGTVLVGLSRFGKLGIAAALNAVITLSGILTLFALGNLTLLSLVLWNVVLPLVSTIPAWVVMPAEWLPWRLRGAGQSLTSGAEVTRRMFGFSRWIIFSNLGSVIVAQGDIILLVRLAEPAVVGIYSVALGLAMRLDVLNQSLFTVMMPRASSLRGTEQMRGYVSKVLRGSLLLAGGLGLVALVAPLVISFFYGDRYAQSIPLFLALLVVVLFDLVTSSLFLLAFPLDKPRVLALTDWVRVVVLGLSGWLLIPLYSGFGAVAARFLARVTGTSLALGMLRHEMDKSDSNRTAAIATSVEE